MVCIYCGSATQVTNSRHQKRVNQVWRRRKCTICDSIFTTHEAVDFATSLMVRYDTSMHSFERDRLLISIYESCRHRPQAQQDATALTATIVSELVAAAKRGVLARTTIVLTAAKVLEYFDAAAATMYRAYHPIE